MRQCQDVEWNSIRIQKQSEIIFIFRGIVIEHQNVLHILTFRKVKVEAISYPAWLVIRYSIEQVSINIADDSLHSFSFIGMMSSEFVLLRAWHNGFSPDHVHHEGARQRRSC